MLGGVLASVVAVVFPACDETVPPPLAGAQTAARFEARPANATCLAPPVPSGPVRLKVLYEGFRHPLRLIDRPGLIYVAEMPGRVKVRDKASGVVTTALDLVGSVTAADELGLFGLVVHPTKPFAYLVVDRDPDATSPKETPYRSEVVRFTIADGGKTFDRASEKLILRIDRAQREHGAGDIAFGPDGMLYIGTGDGMRVVPRYPTDQIVGSILRIDVDKADPYAIPEGNPYARGGGRGEVYAGGFRNPWRFSFDRLNGDLWVGDVGQGAFEEINRVEVGKNYGWPVLEGTKCNRPEVTCDATGLTPPYFAYAHTEGFSVTGGYVYRGKTLPTLAGKYVFADFTTGQLRALEDSSTGPRSIFLNPGGIKPLIAALSEDADGELYALGWDTGSIYKLVAGTDATTPVFAPRLSQTGCVDPGDPGKMATGLVPYGVNVELWSDGADKRRFLAIPDGTTLHAADNGHLDLPKGGVAVKEFSSDGKRIETRFLRHHTDGTWSAATYEWNDDQTDALLLETAKEKTLPNGQTWSFPGRVQCFVCHTAAAGITLGTESLQLNGDFDYARGQRTNQLTTLAAIGYLDRALDLTTTPRLPRLTSGAPVEDRARAYLHANCSNCHRDGGGTGAPMDFRFGLPRSALKGCAVSGNSGGRGTYLLDPGHPELSVIAQRMKSRGTVGYGPMPPLATNRPDDEAAGVLDEWITSLTTCE